MATFEDFKPIRNKIRKFDADKLLRLEVRWMYDLQDMELEKVRMCPPWDLMLLIKWTLMYGEFNSAKRSPKHNDLVGLVNMVRRLWGRVRLPEDRFSANMFLKNISFQQFWYQRKMVGADIGRQIKLFLEFLPQKLVVEMFASKMGIVPEDFFELLFLLAGRVVGGAGYVGADFVGLLGRVYSDETVHRFLSMLSCDLESVRGFLEFEDSRIRDFDARLYAQTPLRRKPLLRIGEGYLCYSPSVLMGGLVTLAYDVFKEQLSEVFTRSFGDGFEKYVNFGLSYSGLRYYGESELKGFYPEGKMVDFLVVLSDVNVFVESKAIEMSPLAQVSPDVRVVNNYLRGSVVKAIKQAMVAAKRVAERPIGGGAVGRKDNFLLIVTFKDLFLGRGDDFVSGGVREEVEDFARKEGVDPCCLPGENIFFISACEFEWIVEICRQGKDLSAMLRSMVEANRESMTRKFLVEQHLREQFGAVEGPGYVVEPYRKMRDGLFSKVGDLG